MDEQEIHVEWTGPYGWRDHLRFSEFGDRGLYQIYGCHPVYGSDVLLYIGKAERQTFARRLSQETWWQLIQDYGRLTLYLGRIGSYAELDDQSWFRQIHLAEKMLITSHLPARNAQKSIDPNDPELIGLRVFNWGCYRSLMPEVSGARWTSHFYTKEGWTIRGPFTDEENENTGEQGAAANP